MEDELEEALVSEVLIELGARATQFDEGFLVTHVPPPDDVSLFVGELEQRLGTLMAGAPRIDWHWQVQEDWEEVWRAGLGPRRVGANLIIRPSWTPYEAKPHDIIVVLDPGLAFGTAEHATTRGSLRLLEGCVEKGQTIADVGTGSAILAVACALLGAGRVDGYEVDPYACEAAQKNIDRNGVSDCVHLHLGEVDGKGLGDVDDKGAGQGFDGLVANIEWVRMVAFVEDLLTWVRPGGWVLLAGILDVQSESVVRQLSDLGFRPVAEDAEEEWWAAVFTKRR